MWRGRRVRRGILRRQRGLLKITGGLTLVLAISCWFFGNFALPRYSDHWEVPPLILWVSSPRYLAVNENEELRIAVKNEGSSSILASFMLDSNSAAPVFIEQEGTNIFFAGDILGAEQIERKLKLFIPFDFGGGQTNNTLGMDVGLTLLGNIELQGPEQIAALPLSVAPFPWHRKLFGAFFSALAGTLAWAFKEWWSIQKEAFGSRR
jgi:hypothetical protein